MYCALMSGEENQSLYGLLCILVEPGAVVAQITLTTGNEMIEYLGELLAFILEYKMDISNGLEYLVLKTRCNENWFGIIYLLFCLFAQVTDESETY